MFTRIININTKKECPARFLNKKQRNHHAHITRCDGNLSPQYNGKNRACACRVSVLCLVRIPRHKTDLSVTHLEDVKRHDPSRTGGDVKHEHRHLRSGRARRHGLHAVFLEHLQREVQHSRVLVENALESRLGRVLKAAHIPNINAISGITYHTAYHIHNKNTHPRIDRIGAE